MVQERPTSNNPEDYQTVDEAVKRALLRWIQVAIIPAKRPRLLPSSYYLKHEFERQTGLYVTNGQFKGAMHEAGYAPVDPNSHPNWHYKIKRANTKFQKQYVLDKEKDPVFEYSIAHLSDRQRVQFDALVQEAKGR